jgi:hypothetical protein
VSRAGRGVAAAIVLATTPLLSARPALAAPRAEVVVVDIPGVALPGLVVAPTVRQLVGSASRGGAGLLVAAGVDPVARLELVAADPDAGVETIRLTDPADLLPALTGALGGMDPTARALVLLVTTPPPGDPPWLGAAVLAEGSVASLEDSLAGHGELPKIGETLTSDSTHRTGAVTGGDVVTTAADAADLRSADLPGGSPIRVVAGPPPVALYERYLDQRRLAVPVGIVTGLYAVVAGLLGLVLLLSRRGSPRTRASVGWAAIAVVPLTAALMLVGHLDRLTYARVFAFLTIATVLALLAMAGVRRREATLGAIAALGVALLAMFVIEAAFGWTAALTPLLGGAQLDGGRFFGLPNVQIGLLMGASLYVAQRLRRWQAGVVLILAAALFAGLPWTGSNIGAAVTIAAAAGIWWGLRADGGRLRAKTILRASATVAGTAALVVISHRYLTDAPTHISRFVSDDGGPRGLWHELVHRLGVGMDLLVRNPFGLIPVLGIAATLWLLLRPPSGLRPSLDAHPAWRDALLTIVSGSIVAYVANDSGAAAIGLGFGTALGGLLYVSLTDAPAMMEAP